jgi:hypothetical protein
MGAQEAPRGNIKRNPEALRGGAACKSRQWKLEVELSRGTLSQERTKKGMLF